ncbi:MAG: MBL fold metallo-hydrolase, partial [Luteibacter sp.]
MTIAARFHRALFVAGLFAVFGIAPTFAAAPSPQAAPTTQVPGYYRFTLGTFHVTALSDGTIDIPFDALLIGRTPNQTSASFRAAYARNFLKLPYETSVNAYLVDTGTRVILIDTGAGTFYGPTLGNLLVNLRAAGYQPGQVSDVLITHMHSDHIGGLLDHGAMAFPNATVWVGKADYDFWLDPANLGKADPSVQDAFATAGATFAPYIAAHRVQTIVGNSNLYPGIDAIASPGHSPGHHFYAIQSAG